MWKYTARRYLLPDTESSTMNCSVSKLKEVNFYTSCNFPTFKNSATVTQNRLNTFANFMFLFHKLDHTIPTFKEVGRRVKGSKVYKPISEVFGRK